MEEHDHKQKMHFSARGAILGFLAYVILVVIIAVIFKVG
jgi:hypothetical protein